MKNNGHNHLGIVRKGRVEIKEQAKSQRKEAEALCRTII
ncbi:hypothetical protein J2746_001738 [Methanolobus bombayensis]|nr:hypothetical protein [Methanolobus bombayensis]